MLAEKVFQPFNFPTAPKIEPAQAEERKAVGPESVVSTESSKDDSVLAEIEPPKFQATVGPSLAKLDPAVARASQRIQVGKL